MICTVKNCGKPIDSKDSESAWKEIIGMCEEHRLMYPISFMEKPPGPKEKILALKDGDCYLWPESDYGKAEIWRKNNVYILFEIPMFGGEPIYDSTYLFDRVDQLIKTVESWT